MLRNLIYSAVECIPYTAAILAGIDAAETHLLIVDCCLLLSPLSPLSPAPLPFLSTIF